MQVLCRALLRLFGWTLVGTKPSDAKVVAIAAPHTSNWDLPLLLAIACAFGIRVSWMGKEELFRRPFGPIMRWLGGIPVRRDAAHNMVEQMVDRFAASEHLVLAVPVEGTRAKADHWKSGFYHIARRAAVPIATSFVDYERKVGGFGPMITLTDDLVADMNRIRAVYEGVVGKHPHAQGPLRLREETGVLPSDDADL